MLKHHKDLMDLLEPIFKKHSRHDVIMLTIDEIIRTSEDPRLTISQLSRELNDYLFQKMVR